MEFRRPTADESRLLRVLAAIAGLARPEQWAENVRVRSMDDGGMGSLEIETPVTMPETRRATVCRAAVQFTDADGAEVIASLYAHEDGVPFELDVWKTDFTSLIRVPTEFRKLDE